jgi:hypothetical protein
MSDKETGDVITSRFFGQSSFAQYSVASERSIVHVRELLHDKDELKLFAPLGCGFQTGIGCNLQRFKCGTQRYCDDTGLGRRWNGSSYDEMALFRSSFNLLQDFVANPEYIHRPPRSVTVKT